MAPCFVVTSNSAWATPRNRSPAMLGVVDPVFALLYAQPRWLSTRCRR